MKIIKPAHNRKQDNKSLISQVYKAYKCSAKHRGLEFKISEEEFLILTQMPCTYCGLEKTNTRVFRNVTNKPVAEGFYSEKRMFRYNGIDRIDAQIGYVLNNCFPCCKNCNYMKSNHTVQEFFDHIVRVYKMLESSGYCDER